MSDTDNNPSRQIQLQPMARGASGIAPARTETSTHPLANLPKPITVPNPITFPNPIPKPMDIDPKPMPTPTKPFRFGEKPIKPIKRHATGSGSRRFHGSSPRAEEGQDISPVEKRALIEKTRLIEQKALATRTEIEQKEQKINELEGQVENYKYQLEMFKARMDELEQRLAMGQQNPSSGPSGQIVQAPNLSMVPVNEGQSKSGGEEMAVDQGNKNPASNDNATVQNSAPVPSAPTGTPVARSENGPSGQIVQAPNLSMVPVNEGQSKSGGEEMAVDQGNKDPASNDNAQVQNSAPVPSAPTGTPVARPENGPSKADKGKGKGKANVIWRQDESMEDCSEEEIAIPMEEDENSDSDDEREESDDEAPEMHPASRKSVPKPIVRFQRPRGGAGPRLKVDPSQPRKSASNTTPNIPTSVPQSLGMTTEQIAAIVQVVMAVQGKGKLPRSKKRSVTGTIVEQSNRENNPRSRELVLAVRRHMNVLLRVEHDKDIRMVPQPPKSVVETFREELENGPSLAPMRLALGYKRKEQWNISLAEMFFDDFLEQNGEQLEITEDEWPIIYEKFWQRFSNLQRVWKAWQKKEGEDEKDVQHRNSVRTKNTQKTARRDSRRNHLAQQRIEIAEGNKKKADGSVDDVWEFLSIVATSLGLGGMSSDESSVETGGSPRKYVIKAVEWRSKELIPYLQMIDRDFNRYNCFGNVRPGNPYRERTRLAGAKASTRSAIKGLPINFYDATWLANLSNEERNFLEPAPKMDLPTIIEYED